MFQQEILQLYTYLEAVPSNFDHLSEYPSIDILLLCIQQFDPIHHLLFFPFLYSMNIDGVYVI